MAVRRKKEKVSVTLPGELVAEVRAAVTRGEVSAFFTEALSHYLVYRRQRHALERSFGAWKAADHPDLAAPDDSTAYVRSLRAAGHDRLKCVEEGAGS